LRVDPGVVKQPGQSSNNIVRQDCKLRVNNVSNKIDENTKDEKGEKEVGNDESTVAVVSLKGKVAKFPSPDATYRRSLLGDQRHLLPKTSKTLNPETLKEGKTTVKSRIKEFENRNKNYTRLVKRTPIKVKRGKIAVKSPICKKKDPSRKNSPVMKSNNSDKKKVLTGEFEVNSDKIKKIIGSLDENLKNGENLVSKLTPKKPKGNQVDVVQKTNEVEKNTLENAFQRLMGAKGGTLQKTPVKVKIKRIERRKDTISEQRFLDLKTWASKKPKKD